MNMFGFIPLFATAAAFLFASTVADAAPPSFNSQQADTNTTTQPLKNNSGIPGQIPNSMIPRRDPMQMTGDPKDMDTMTIIDIIGSDPSFSTLTQALNAADLNAVLSRTGPFTIFAPNDAAFSKLSPNKLADLLSPENKEKLIAVLTYHVVPGKITTDKLTNSKIRTLHGKPLNIKNDNGTVTVNNAKITKPDQIGTNGVVQVIDAVLLP